MDYNFNGTIKQNGQELSGGKVYLHNIKLSVGSYSYMFVFINTNNTAFTTATLAKWLYDHGYKDHGSAYPYTNMKVIQAGSVDIYTGIAGYNESHLAFYGFNISTGAEVYPEVTVTSDTPIEL